MSKAGRKQPSRSVLLNIGVDQAYLSRRHEALASAGFTVVDAASVEEGLKLAKGRDVQVAILGHRISPTERLKISQALKRGNSKIRLVVMYDRSISKTELADAVLQIDLPPTDLVHSIEYLLDAV